LKNLIWQRPGWPNMYYDRDRIVAEVALVRRAQGIVEGKLAALGLPQRQELTAEAWVQEAASTAAIEGERLDLQAVRSSVARRLGIAGNGGPATPRHVDGLLDIMDDAIDNAAAPLSHDRLQAWQAALFPTGFSGMSRIRTGAYRDHAEPMQIVSGRPGRVLIDLALARGSGEASRLIRISQRLLEKRADYYGELERAQHGSLDVTGWTAWFITQVRAACEQASAVMDASLEKAQFWYSHRDKELTPRQRKAINALLDAGPDGYEGGMSTKKYEHLTGASRATSSRDLIELAHAGLLRQDGAGRSTRYGLNIEGWNQKRPANVS
jgi:Fic family protein